MNYVNKKARERVEWALAQAVRENRVKRDGEFLYRSTEQLDRLPRELGSRRLDNVAPTELAQTVVCVAGDFLGPKDKLIIEVARLLGFSHTGPRIKEIIGGQIEEMLSNGGLELSLGSIRPPRSPQYS